jgi:hypothetical protein
MGPSVDDRCQAAPMARREEGAYSPYVTRGATPPAQVGSAPRTIEGSIRGAQGNQGGRTPASLYRLNAAPDLDFMVVAARLARRRMRSARPVVTLDPLPDLGGIG